jgi:hypothetical protein
MTMSPSLRIPDWWMSDDMLIRARACLIAQMDALTATRLSYEKRNPLVSDEVEDDEHALERLLGLVLTEQRKRSEDPDRWVAPDGWPAPAYVAQETGRESSATTESETPDALET